MKCNFWLWLMITMVTYAVTTAFMSVEWAFVFGFMVASLWTRDANDQYV